MKRTASEIAELLQMRPLGSTVWLRGLGRSMAPILKSGDALQILRCTPSDLAPGDVAVFRQSTGQLTAHVVRAVQPLRTRAFLGAEDAKGSEIIGRVTAVRRGPRVVPFPAALRRPFWMLHHLATAAYGNAVTRATARTVREVAASSWTLPLRRRLLGPLEVRLLSSEDLERVLLFAGDYLALPAVFLERQLSTRWSIQGAAAGALTRSGKLAAFVYADEYCQEGIPLDGFWVRFLFVAPIARGMGIAQALIGAVCDDLRRQGVSRIWADVQADNATSLTAFHRQGFVVSQPATAEVNRVIPGRSLVALERKL